jgi:hypothetical protein
MKQTSPVGTIEEKLAFPGFVNVFGIAVNSNGIKGKRNLK